MSHVIQYHLEIPEPKSHLMQVRITIQTANQTGHILSMPNWLPGSYKIRDFAKGITKVEAVDTTGTPLTITKLSTNRWQIAPSIGTVIVKYAVYAWDISVRGAHVDDEHAFLNASCVLMMVENLDQFSHQLTVKVPGQTKGWHLATAMTPTKIDRHGFGVYQATSYDELIDHPIEMGTFERITFDVLNVPHHLIITGRHNTDYKAVSQTIAKICAIHHRMFGAPKIDFNHYYFFIQLVGDGYGGLEHRASTALIYERDQLAGPKYGATDTTKAQILSLFSHEYFHSWMIKRLKPAVFCPYELNKPAYTAQLWAFEGITSYYDDLACLRAGAISFETYLKVIAKTISAYLSTPGRHIQSVAESSQDAWIKQYQADESTPNMGISYYLKGTLVALCLDMMIREQTNNTMTLDDVMRAVWAKYAHLKTGLDECAIEQMVLKMAGQNVYEQLKEMVYTTEELPMASALRYMGIEATYLPSDGDNTAITASEAYAYFGAKIDDDNEVIQVKWDTPAYQAGLNVRDRLVAINGWRLTKTNMKNLLKQQPINEPVPVQFFRHDVLRETMVTFSALPTMAVVLKTIEAEDACAKRREQWITEYQS